MQSKSRASHYSLSQSTHFASDLIKTAFFLPHYLNWGFSLLHKKILQWKKDFEIMIKFNVSIKMFAEGLGATKKRFVAI